MSECSGSSDVDLALSDLDIEHRDDDEVKKNTDKDNLDDNDEFAFNNVKPKGTAVDKPPAFFTSTGVTTICDGSARERISVSKDGNKEKEKVDSGERMPSQQTPEKLPDTEGKLEKILPISPTVKRNEVQEHDAKHNINPAHPSPPQKCEQKAEGAEQVNALAVLRQKYATVTHRPMEHNEQVPQFTAAANAVGSTQDFREAAHESDHVDDAGDEWDQATRQFMDERKEQVIADEVEESSPATTIQWLQAYQALRFPSVRDKKISNLDQNNSNSVPTTKTNWRQYLPHIQRDSTGSAKSGSNKISGAASASGSAKSSIRSSFWNMCWGLWHTDITPGTPLYDERDFILCLMKVPLDHSDPLHRRILLTIYSRSVNVFGYNPAGGASSVACSPVSTIGDKYGDGALQEKRENSIIPGIRTTGAAAWERLGFQGNDPGTDLRFSGLYGLLMFLYVVDTAEHQTNTKGLVTTQVESEGNGSFARDTRQNPCDEADDDRPTKLHRSFTKKLYDVSLSRLLNFPLAIVIFNFVGIALELLLRRDLHDYIHHQHQDDLHCRKNRILRQQVELRKACSPIGGPSTAATFASSANKTGAAAVSLKDVGAAAEQIPTTAVATVVNYVTMGMLHYFLEVWCEQPTRSIIDFDAVKKQTSKHCLSNLKDTIKRGQSCTEKQKNSAQQQQLANLQKEHSKKKDGSKSGNKNAGKSGRSKIPTEADFVSLSNF